MDNKYLGKHYMLDIKFMTNKPNKVLGILVFQSMLKVIAEYSTLKVVHSHLEILEKDTPLGFTSILLLDSSHMSAHCYYELGKISFDIYSCGNNDPKLIGEKLLEMLNEYCFIQSEVLLSTQLDRF